MDKTLLMNAASTAWQRLLLLWMTCKEVTLDTGDGPGLQERRVQGGDAGHGRFAGAGGATRLAENRDGLSSWSLSQRNR